MHTRALAALAVALCATSAQARVSWSTPGSYRIDTRLFNADLVDQDNTLYGMHRLRIDPRIEVGPFLLRLEVDVLTGQFFGDTDSTGERFVPGWRGNPERSYDGWTTVEPRLGWVELEFGL